MSSHLLIEAAGPTVMLTAVLGVSAVVTALTSVLRTWIEQVSRTRRLIRALEDSRPYQRPGIIRACSQLEGAPGGKPSDDTTNGRPPGRKRPAPPMLILQDRHDHEYGED
ncbi:MAG TPA: hypothetical protein VFE59_36685 [Trebonia sp.]|jgi:hypothetical protein|nr:hypothetical protein [Trebonia sp.]